jgi:hypothetical protein
VDEITIADFFENNNVIMDGEAAYTLFDMGLGHLIGIKNVTWYSQNSGYQSYEEVCNGKHYCGIDSARLSAQNICGSYADIEYENPVEKITAVKNYYGEHIGNGMTMINNSVFILPFGKFDGQIQSHLYPIRQQVIQEVISRMDKRKEMIFVKNSPYVLPCLYDNYSGKKILLLLNFSNDDYSSICMYAPNINEGNIKVISRNELRQRKIKCVRSNDDIKLYIPLKRLETIMLFLE